MTTIEQIMRRRMRANRLSRWVAMLFFVLGTSLYAAGSDIARILLPVRTISVFSLLISGILFVIQLIEFRRLRTHPPIVVVTGIILSFALAGYVYVWEFNSYRENEIVFESEGISLSGTLYLPPEKGIYPAAVVAPGPLQASRRLYHVWADMLVRRGIAAFIFDKRGTGDSGGTYESEEPSSTRNLFLLAADIEAAVRTTMQQPEVDSASVGLIGVSLGAWTAYIAADSLRDMAFMACLSGPTVSVGEETYFTDLTGSGNGQKEDLSDDSLIELLAHQEAAGFDPRSILRNMAIPALWIYGGRDLSIPVQKSLTVLDDLMTVYERPFRYRTFDRANHLLVLPDLPYRFPSALQDELVGFITSTVQSAHPAGGIPE